MSGQREIGIALEQCGDDTLAIEEVLGCYVLWYTHGATLSSLLCRAEVDSMCSAGSIFVVPAHGVFYTKSGCSSTSFV